MNTPRYIIRRADGAYMSVFSREPDMVGWVIIRSCASSWGVEADAQATAANLRAQGHDCCAELA